MTTQGEDILAYLDHAITAAERLARGAKLRSAGHWTANEEGASFAVSDDLGDVVVYDEGAPSGLQPDHIALHDPASVLRRCAADRKLIAEHGPFSATDLSCKGCGLDSHEDMVTGYYEDCPVLCALAEGYGWTEGER